MGLREATAVTEAGTSNSNSDAGPSGSGGVRRFPLAAQPEIMRAAEKDDQYASFVYDACRDAFRHLFGTRVAVAYQSETKLLGQMLYYVLTTGAGKQTLGEEYCDITQVAAPYGLPPTPARRSLFIFYQTAFPYIAERISSRIASQGITMADSLSDDIIDNETISNSQIQPSVSAEMSSSLNSGVPLSALSRLKGRITGLWLYAVRRWPSVLPFARECFMLVLRANLMFFYFEGLYYHLSKRAAGIRYVFIGKPTNQRPRYQILGVFLLVQLCIIAAEGLRRSNLSTFATSFQQTSLGAYQTSAGRGLPVLNEEGNLITEDAGKCWVHESTSTSEFVADGVFFAELNEVLTRELAEDGYSGVEVRVTPMRTEIIIRATRTQNVLGEKGRRIRELTSVVQKRFKFPENSVELYAEKVNNRGLCAIAQAESLRYKLLGGLAVRRACYGVLRFVMESGAKGCEVIVSGKLRAQRAKSMKFKDGYMISSGQPVKEYIDSAVRHVLLRQGVLGIKVKIMLDWDPKGKQGPMTPLPDLVTIHPPKEEEYVPPTVIPAVEVA
ncbi:Peroxisome biogenesis factor 10 [Sesamum alatum]|uniref:Peroxisome biogenesis factor 10 n=1 Tax=Sesamum alatum TaxID=300844 RepID=A0AAE1XIN8_9LAMI|nr:Peroxisome biogenesis factor 10 [Sesamum alatum]